VDPILTDEVDDDVVDLGGADVSGEALAGRVATLPENKSKNQLDATKEEIEAKVAKKAEAGQRGFDMGSWQAVFAPAGTPQPIVDRLHAEIMKIVATPDLQARLKGFGMVPSTMTPAELGEYQKVEVAKWADVIKAAGIKAE
jgi:tripartite-type tricarboxylate transporter receptor subunit TctC